MLRVALKEKAMTFLSKVRKLLGLITDALLKGREAGLWNKKPGS